MGDEELCELGYMVSDDMGGMWVMKSYVSRVIWWVMIWVACG